MDEPHSSIGLSDSARMHAIIEGIYAKTPYFKSMPCTIETVAVGRVRVGFDISRHICNYRNIASGGVLAAFCDTLMGMACRTMGFRVTTLEINMNYVRSVNSGEHITGIGQVLHQGRNTIVVECECRDTDGNVIVKGRSSFYILKKID